jgi:RHS repeat-associated protein
MKDVETRQYASAIKYGAGGMMLLERSLAGGTAKETRVYNWLGQMTGLDVKNGAATRLSLGWVYGDTANNGNVQRHTITADGSSFTQHFGYDAANRLRMAVEKSSISQDLSTATCNSLQASWPSSESCLRFGYDGFGNLWNEEKKNARGVRFESANWFLQPPGVSPRVTNRLAGVSYDAAGNLTQYEPADVNSVAVFDGEGRVTALKDVSTNPARVIASYGYNGEGQRVRKTVGNTAYYVYGLDGEVAQEYSGAFDTGGTRYVIADHLGSTRMTLDESGQPVTRHDFEPYGVEIDRSGGGYGSPETVTRLFTGKERDFEAASSANVSGLDYFGARYYSGAQGRFTGPDEPLIDQHPEDPQSWNLYSYVRNNPLKFIDPTGNDCVYVNRSGTGIDSINNQNTSKDCGKTGGYWVDGTVTDARFAHGSLVLTGTTDGTNRTSASYGLGPDPGLLALQRGTQLAEPGVNLAGQGLMLFASIGAPLPTALANCVAGNCDGADVAMAMIPGSGGGKTGRKVGQKAYEAAKESVDLLRRVLKRLEATPNKTPSTKEAIKIVEGRLKDALERLRKSEPHGISGQGPGR